MTDRTWQDRAHEDLRVAQLLHDVGHAEATISRAYYAAFYAAKAALDRLGQQRETHAGVISAFGRFAVKEGGADPAAGRALRRLFDSRNRADYDLVSVSNDDALASIDRAKIVVDAVDAWLAKR